METQPILSMPITSKTILRLSIYTFLKHYQYLTSIASTLALPFALSVLFSQVCVPHFSNFYPTIANNLHSLCKSSTFLPFIDVNVSQTIITFIFTFPLSVSFLLLAKASVISTIFNKKKCFISLYKPLLVTHLCNYLVIFSISATCFCLLVLALAFFEGFQITTSPRWTLFLSIICAVSYFIVLANALVICNLALVSSAMDEGNGGGVIAILEACVMIKGRTAIALGLILPINLGLASIESLFHYRVATPWNQSISFGVKNKKIWVIGFEGVFVAYLYSMIILLDVIISCLFYQSCKMNKFTYHYNSNDDNGDKLKALDHYV